IMLRPSLLVAFSTAFLLQVPPSAHADDDLVQTVSSLVCDKDKDVRAIGLEQVRDEVKGPEATRRFAGLLPKLVPDAQVGLLGALAERGDVAARPAVLDLLNNSQAEVRGAAIRALGALGDKDDVSRLTKLLGEANGEKDAVAAITRLHGEGINAALCAEIKTAAPAQRVKLLQLLVARRAVDTVPSLLDAAKDADAGVRVAALEALGQLAGPELVAKLAHLILDAKDTAARDEAEKALMFIAQRNPEIDLRAVPLLKVMSGLSETEKTMLLPVLGRIGGSPALKVIEEALAEKDGTRSSAALRALCNWPDGSVAPRLVEFVLAAKDPAGRKRVLDALIRVAPLPDKRPDTQRLAMLKKAMELASSNEQKAQILKRARAIRSLETLRFVAPYMDQPEFTQLACQTVVELAHHKVLRQPNKAEFSTALDKVIALSKDPVVLLRAKRYQKDETWVEKQIQGAGK
ncbi:MAG: HEAT repeat domain-containing protein, partial [Planctomycetota bacterium]